MRRLDYWIGTRLFHPPIIWICQRVGMSQNAFAAYAWLAATFTVIMRLRFDAGFGELILAIGVSLLALAQTVLVALIPDLPRRPSYTFRLVIWALLIFDTVAIGQNWLGKGELVGGWAEAWNGIALFGEYAKTTTNIPPRKRRERRAEAKQAYS